ncbi:hypothetical protein Anapl_09696 [Anas platyrhynchos]|uniref:Uncharacterized protein n=1 Tax=Anas platyrhynchos TaxID=8839 RepID=R0LEP0_ANAPL|nr:hypothetical protein Anapl_09696 [Anas platyrhynchos]
MQTRIQQEGEHGSSQDYLFALYSQALVSGRSPSICFVPVIVNFALECHVGLPAGTWRMRTMWIPVLLFTPWDPCSPDGLAWCSLANICTHPTGTPYLQIPPVTSMGPLLTCYIYLELGPSAHQLVQVRTCQLFCTPCTSSYGKVQTQPQHLAPGTQAVTHGPASVADSACKQMV